MSSYVAAIWTRRNAAAPCVIGPAARRRPDPAASREHRRVQAPARPAPSDINYFLYTLGRRHCDARDCRLGFVSNRAGRGPRRRRLQARRPAGDGYTTTHDFSTPDICPPGWGRVYEHLYSPKHRQ